MDDLLDQNEMDGPVFEIEDAPRIIRVGKFIRKTSIDELSQLWNILKGDMSIVGSARHFHAKWSSTVTMKSSACM